MRMFGFHVSNYITLLSETTITLISVIIYSFMFGFHVNNKIMFDEITFVSESTVVTVILYSFMLRFVVSS